MISGKLHQTPTSYRDTRTVTSARHEGNRGRRGLRTHQPILSLPSPSSMSVTLASKPPDHELQHHQTLTELADHAVFENRAVCDECFARVRANDGRRAYRGTIGHDVVEKDAYGAITDYEARTTCADCGSIGCRPVDETLSIQQAVDRVPRLASRLEEAGHSPNIEAMYYAVREGKTRDGLHGHDDDLFRLAARVGLRQGDVDR